MAALASDAGPRLRQPLNRARIHGGFGPAPLPGSSSWGFRRSGRAFSAFVGSLFFLKASGRGFPRRRRAAPGFGVFLVGTQGYHPVSVDPQVPSHSSEKPLNLISASVPFSGEAMPQVLERIRDVAVTTVKTVQAQGTM